MEVLALAMANPAPALTFPRGQINPEGRMHSQCAHRLQTWEVGIPARNWHLGWEQTTQVPVHDVFAFLVDGCRDMLCRRVNAHSQLLNSGCKSCSLLRICLC